MACADQATSHYLKQWWFVYRGIYASLGLNELKAPVAKHLDNAFKFRELKQIGNV